MRLRNIFGDGTSLILGLSLCICICITLIAPCAFASPWSATEKLLDEQKNQAALEKTREIRIRASQSGQHQLATDGLIRETQLLIGLHGHETAVRFLRETPWPKDATSQIALHLFFAKSLMLYQQIYAWEISQREKVSTKLSVDVKAWTTEDIGNEISKAFDQAMSHQKALQARLPEELNVHFKKNNYPSGILPTFRDTVVYLAVNHFLNSQFWSPAQVNETYKLSVPELLAPKGPRLTAELSGPHPLQKLSSWLGEHRQVHESAGRKEAALESQYRLHEALHLSFAENKDRKSIIVSLRQLQTDNARLPWWSRGQALLAEFLQASPDPDRLVVALAEAKKGALQFPNSVGAEMCNAVVKLIEAPAYVVSSMLSDRAAAESLMLEYKNLTHVWFRIYPLSLEQTILERQRGAFQKPIESLLKQLGPPLLSWSVDLPQTSDFQMHRKLVAVPKTGIGSYLILASSREDFGATDNVVQWTRFSVTDIVTQVRAIGRNQIEAQITSGHTGDPIASAKVFLYRSQWDKSPELVATKLTGKDGIVQFDEPRKAKNQYWNYFLVARHRESIALSAENIYFGRSALNQMERSALLFTDRSIYRPQQKILWKAALYTGKRSEGQFAMAPAGTSVTVKLLDLNNKVAGQMSVKTNSFGTASGEFLIPAGRPLGQWRIAIDKDYQINTFVRIEEYKRPTFEPELNDINEIARLNRPVKVKGQAKYYFGLPVTSGSVSWRVTRQESWPRWSTFKFFHRHRNSAPQIIATGSSPLDSTGGFSILFRPEADENSAEGDRSYQFTLTADVTDEGGETRSASRTFRIGFRSAEATITGKSDFFPVNSPINMSAELASLDGKGKSGSARYRLVHLIQPQKTSLPSELPRNETSDLLLADDQRRARWETDHDWRAVVSRWNDGNEIAKGEILHLKNGKAELKLAPIAHPGAYRIYYDGQDDFATPITFSRDFLIINDKSALPLPLALLAEKGSFEVGERARFFLHSGFEEQKLVIEQFRGGKLVARRNFAAGKSPSVIEFPIGLQDRGGFTVVARGIRDFQELRSEQNINVPWTDRNLKIEYSHFRDKLQPGAKETFTLTVRDSTGKPLGPKVAEVLTYMYDRSLELFAPHTFPQVPELYPQNFGVAHLSSSLGLRTGQIAFGQFPARPHSPFLWRDDVKVLPDNGVGGPGRRVRFKGKLEASSFLGQSGNLEGLAEGEASADRAESKKSAPAAPLGGALADAATAGSPRPAAASDPAGSLRHGFSETAFFSPHLTLDRKGSARISFQVPDSVTSWQIMAHALTRDFRGGALAREAKSIKDLMVRPYVPRFVREGDLAEMKVNVNNGSEKNLSGLLSFDIVNAETGENMNHLFGLQKTATAKTFKIESSQSATFNFPLKIPRKVGLYAVRARAVSGNMSDGELRSFPILPSRLHLAQSRFASLRDRDKKVLEFSDLANAEADPTLTNEKLVVTLDAQLFYGVLQALPYLVDYPYDCTEQTLNRFLATGIVSSVFAKHPAVAQMAKTFSSRRSRFAKFDGEDPNRRMLLEESPWLHASAGHSTAGHSTAGQSEKPATLARVLDPAFAKTERQRSLSKLHESQLPNGGFPWFQGGPPDRYMTLYVLVGLGRALEHKIEVPKDLTQKAWAFTRKWLDEDLGRMMGTKCCWDFITLIGYATSLYPDASWTDGKFDREFRERLLNYSFTHWKSHSPLLKGYLALTLHRAGRTKDAQLVWESVMDSAKHDDRLGTYWSPEDRSWLWYNDQIETHAFSLRTQLELDPTSKHLNGLIQWLFLNKHLNQWKSTRATAEVIYALVHFLEKTSSSPGAKETIQVDLGTQKATFEFDPRKYTGKKNQIVIAGEKLSAQNAKVTVEKSTPGLAFASATWHYSTEKLPARGQGDFFQISRSYFRRENNGKEFILTPLTERDTVKVGDQIEVQISLRTQHEAEYVHLRDPRAAGLEPGGVVSGHKWDLGIHWYEETRDSGSNFFFSKLPAGEYTFKYRLRANMSGKFRLAPAIVQSMYAPEFLAYSSGTTLEVQDKQ